MARAKRGLVGWIWRGVHLLIIANFAVQMAYAAYMVFVVWAPEHTSGPLWQAARELPFEHMVTRRLYALEFWLATVGLSVYLALTEIGPRLKRERAAQSAPDA